MNLFNLFKPNTFKKVSRKKKSITQEKETLKFLDKEVHVLRRSYQRSINMIVRPNGTIRVTCAKRTSIKVLKEFLLGHKDWLEKNLQEQEALQKKFPQKKYIEGETFLFQGENMVLRFVSTHKKRAHAFFQKGELLVEVPKTQWFEGYTKEPHPECKSIILATYKKRSQINLTEKINYWAARMNLNPTKLSFRSQKTRWGSCSSAGHISLNWRLIAAPSEVQDYVVIHELAHLTHQNHSKKFWQLVEKHSPFYKDHKKWLRDHQFEFDFLSQVSELHH